MTPRKVFGLAVLACLMLDVWILHPTGAGFSLAAQVQALSLQNSPASMAPLAGGLFLAGILLVRPLAPALPGWLLLSGFLITLCGCMGTIASASQDPAAGAGAFLCLAGLMAGFIGALLPKDWRDVILVLTAGALVCGTAMIFRLATDPSLIRSGDVVRTTGFSARPLDAVALLLMALPALAAGIYTARGWRSWVLAGLFAFSAAALILSWYRSALAAASASLIHVAWKLAPRAHLVTWLVVLTLTVWAGILVRSSSGRSASATQASSLGRTASWQKGWEAFTARPLTGHGVTVFEATLPELNPRAQRTTIPIGSPQNFVLEFLAAMGIMGGVALLLMGSGAVGLALRAKQAEEVALVSGWIGFAALGLFNMTLLSHDLRSDVLFGLLVGMTVRSLEMTPPAGEEAGREAANTEEERLLEPST